MAREKGGIFLEARPNLRELAAGALLLFSTVTGCDFAAIKRCQAAMESSQAAMIQFSEGDREDLAAAAKTLQAVQSTLTVCKEAGRSEDIEKITKAEAELVAHIKLLNERQNRMKEKPLTDAELSELEKKGDPSCPSGQQYEHHQNKALIKCTGAQIVEMNWSEAVEYYERRGFTLRPAGEAEATAAPLLRAEKGAQVVDFEYAVPNSKVRAKCVTTIADPGIPWQETVTRMTGVHPRYIALDEAVKTKKGSLDLLVEGGPEQYTVKLGMCAPTPGQKAVKPAAEAE